MALPKTTKRHLAYIRKMEAAGGTHNLEIVLSSFGEQDVVVTLACFQRREHFTPEMEHKVIEAARGAMAEFETKSKRIAEAVKRGGDNPEKIERDAIEMVRAVKAELEAQKRGRK